MKSHDYNGLSGLTAAVFLALVLGFAGPAPAVGAEAIHLATQTEVDDTGGVTVVLKVDNRGTEPLFHLHPMFHFHHTVAHMPMIHRLGPGETRTLVNAQHPPVVREGSYPVVAMVRYKKQAEAPATFTLVHTDSFFYKKPLVSQIEGRIESSVQDDLSLLKIKLKNATSSFKNLRLMLLLPPELKSKSFSGMMGFTIQGGEEKYFEVPVQKVGGMPGGQFPVHLMVEYGEMVNHYSGEIVGRINFGPLWDRGPLWPQLLVFLFLSTGLLMVLRRRWAVSPVI